MEYRTMSLRMKYFVLKASGDTPYARASRAAMRVFAAEIEQSDPQLANQLKSWTYEEERKVHVERLNEST